MILQAPVSPRELIDRVSRSLDGLHPIVRLMNKAWLTSATIPPERETRKQHLVPKFYLRRWMEDGSVRVTRTGSDRSTLRHPAATGYATDFYRMELDENYNGSPVLHETYLGLVENAAARLISTIAPGRVDVMDTDRRTLLLYFVALQMTRGPGQREGQKEQANSIFQMLASLPADPSSDAGNLGAADDRDRFMNQNNLLRLSDSGALSIFVYLAMRDIVVYRTHPGLITADEPVVALDRNLGSLTAKTGVANAPIVVFPLGPELLLAMFLPGRPILDPTVTLSRKDVRSLNAAILGNSYQFAFEAPSTSFAESNYVPDRRPVRTEVVRTDPDGSQLMRQRVPRRWAGRHGAPVRPVNRWWPDSYTSDFDALIASTPEIAELSKTAIPMLAPRLRPR